MKIDVENDYNQLEKFIRVRHSMKDIRKVELEVGFIGSKTAQPGQPEIFFSPIPITLDAISTPGEPIAGE